MSRPTAAELARSEAYHGPLARCRVVQAAVRVVLAGWLTAVVTAAPDGAGGSGGAAGRALRIGAAVALAGVPGGLLAGLWRELVHEPTRGPVPGPYVTGHGGGQPGIAVPGRRRAGVVAVVVADVMVRAVWSAVVVAASVSAVVAWRGAPPVVALAVVPIGMSFGVPAVLFAARRFGPRLRLAADAAEPLPADRLPAVLARLDAAVAPGLQPRWYRAGAPGAARGEGGYVIGPGPQPVVVLAPDVLDGPPALLDAVAAHELGHVAAGHRPGRARRWWPVAAGVGGAAVGVAVGVALPLVPGLGEPGRWHVLAVFAVRAAVVPVDAWWSRREEAAADRWAARRVTDPEAAADAVCRQLVADGADLRPTGVRRWWAHHPAVGERLALLAAGDGTRPAVERQVLFSDP